MASFVAQLEELNAAAEMADGFVWRLQDDDGPGAHQLPAARRRSR
ncbi:MAG: DUF3291 domain-containing protein [Actinobacteria bacterium]|nr:DUF3291 domain-containing protein [Actinomycetota bacterium]